MVSAIKEEAAEQARRQKEVDGLYTNVKIIVAGLRKYGSMWEGIDAMASQSRSRQPVFELCCSTDLLFLPFQPRSRARSRRPRV